MTEHMIVRANARRSLPIASESVHCIVTSPPYFGLRNYGVDGQLGLEKTPDEFIANQVEVFRECHRVLRSDGQLWLNCGDSFQNGRGMAGGSRKYAAGDHAIDALQPARRPGPRPTDRPIPGLKTKDLIGIPWMLALALRADGWYLRSEIIWNKPNAMPESVTDRPPRSHETVFLLTKAPRYYYDDIAERRPQATLGRRHEGKSGYRPGHPSKGGIASRALNPLGGAVRSVWSITTKPFKSAHFAVMPIDLAARCIRLGSSEKGVCRACGAPWVRVVERRRKATRPGTESKTYAISPGKQADSGLRRYVGFNDRYKDSIGNRDPRRHVTEVEAMGWESSCTCREPYPVPAVILDPYGGAATTARAAQLLGRHSISTELSAEYIAIGRARLREALPVTKGAKGGRKARATAIPAGTPALGGPAEIQRPLFSLD